MVIDDVGRCRASTMRAAMFGLCLCGSLPAFAATLGDIAAALAAPAGAPQATNDWTAFAKLAGAKWQGKAPAKGGNKYYWNGTVPINGVGPGGISLVGDQGRLHSATVNWPKDIKLATVPEMLAVQFPKDATLEQVRGACPDERLSGSRIYRATLAGRKPLYLHIQYAAADRGGSTSTIEMEPQRNKLLDLLMDNVRVVRLGRRADARSSHRVLRPRALALTADDRRPEWRSQLK